MNLDPKHPAPPPAAFLVMNGTRSEASLARERELEQKLNQAARKLLAMESRAADTEKHAAELEQQNQAARETAAAQKRKRKPHWSDPVIGY